MLEGLDLVVVEQRGELERDRRGQRARSPASSDRRHRLAAELPDDRAQLELRREAQALVDRPRSGRPGPRRTWPLLRSVLLARTSNTHMAMQLRVEVLPVLVEREVVLLEVGLDEQLERALAEWARRAGRWAAPAPSPAPPRGGRRPPPAGRGRGGSPTADARPGPACRRRGTRASPAADGDEEGGVGAPRQAALDLDLAALEQGERRPVGRHRRPSVPSVHPRARVAVRVHRAGRRTGTPGRPEATSSVARPAKASAWPRVSSQPQRAPIERGPAKPEPGRRRRRPRRRRPRRLVESGPSSSTTTTKRSRSASQATPSWPSDPRPAPPGRPARARWAAARRPGRAGPAAGARGTDRARPPAASRT